MQTNFELKSLIYGKYKNQSALAEALRWPRQRFSKIVTGQRMPDVEELNELAAALDEPIDRLVQIFLREKSPNRQLTG